MAEALKESKKKVQEKCSGTAKAPAIILVVGLLMAGLLAK